MYGRMYNKSGETLKLAFPAEWHTAWRKGKTNESKTWLEDGQARAVEIAITMGGSTPLWTGNVTKAWVWLLEWGNAKPQKMTKLIKGIRDTLKQFAAVTWKYRCKVNEIAIVQHKMEDATYSKKLAQKFVKQNKCRYNNSGTNKRSGRRTGTMQDIQKNALEQCIGKSDQHIWQNVQQVRRNIKAGIPGGMAYCLEKR
jgi:hypothetical protein